MNETQRTIGETEYQRLLLKVTEIEHRLPHSVELTRNAKGEYGWTIKRYFADNDGSLYITEKIAGIDAALRERFLP